MNDRTRAQPSLSPIEMGEAGELRDVVGSKGVGLDTRSSDETDIDKDVV